MSARTMQQVKKRRRMWLIFLFFLAPPLPFMQMAIERTTRIDEEARRMAKAKARRQKKNRRYA